MIWKWLKTWSGVATKKISSKNHFFRDHTYLWILHCDLHLSCDFFVLIWPKRYFLTYFLSELMIVTVMITIDYCIDTLDDMSLALIWLNIWMSTCYFLFHVNIYYLENWSLTSSYWIRVFQVFCPIQLKKTLEIFSGKFWPREYHGDLNFYFTWPSYVIRSIWFIGYICVVIILIW